MLHFFKEQLTIFAEVKQAIAIFLIFLISTPLLVKVFIVSNYLADYHYYATVLCENKEIPEMKCNGTCHLAKEIKQAQENEGQPEMPGSISYEPVFFQYPQYDYDFGLNTKEKSLSDYLSLEHASPFIGRVLPPPRA